jgi:hypothetical protein
MPPEPQRVVPGDGPELTTLELGILAFEGRWTGRLGAKEAAIRTEFDLSAARYYQVLDGLIESPVALRRDPILVRRLQRLRDARARARAARTFRIDPTHQDPTD